MLICTTLGPRGAETAHVSPQPQSLELFLILMDSSYFVSFLTWEQ